MSRNEIIEKLRSIVEMVTESEIEGKLSEDARLIEDIGLNSVGIIYIVVGIEDEFSIRFDGVGFGDFKTIGDVVNYIEKKI